ncbi:MAG: DNA-binding transcriptional regulator Fis [Halomonas sp.]|jgi:Fis family transcriptional regulator|uniref:Putative Fis-like DNA-binding protein n=1 Tax=Billgrantia tianxiuensis TaxID=2497861 RepID=A0A6I6SJ77_9GAMM|nr:MULTISPECIES: DNA-binding transcriptional regulator Fis [Halomonas]MCE8034744.1 DNA-binding transcriptional regulator Fis [Halomonas sp. MCCC 1A11057]MDX5434619.1 DNA-binding transcriptional regulator Fis [Halomonas sp.]QHC50589.1 DNA-binding transcriptional regulator Fis [Halomonas tianxiuensis]
MNREAFDPNADLPGLEDGPCADLTDLDSPSLASATLAEQPLREAVDAAMRRYFDHLDGGTVTDLYAMVMAEVEAPLLASVLEHTQGNQTRAAEMLGLNRGTLRKKLKQHDLI